LPKDLYRVKVDFYRHSLLPRHAEAVAAVLATPFLTTGKVAQAVEAQLAEYFSLPYALLVNSWTNGALAALLALDIGPGDEVIVPAMTFIASANVVELVGAKVVFDPSTLLLTPELAAKRVTRQTRAVIPVHLYGQMCDIPALRKMLESHPARSQRVCLIEDCAHCFEGERDGTKPGAHSDVAIFSFYATKNITCGEGGAIVTGEAELYQRMLETRVHGMSSGAIDRFAANRYNHWDMRRLGTKANLPDLLAALLPDQIATVDERLCHRRAIANRYRQAFAGGPLRSVTQLQCCKSAEHLFAIGVPNGMRDAAIAALNAAGVSVTVNYRSVPETTFYKKRYPAASAACQAAYGWGTETLSLPLYGSLSREEQDYVIQMVHDRVYPLAR
jgi:dTDP-4-amino-4,6-dideoxygalactose transaminase